MILTLLLFGVSFFIWFACGNVIVPPAVWMLTVTTSATQRKSSAISSTIIGARTLEQLDANLASLGVELPVEDITALDDLTKPQLGYPMNVLPLASLSAHSSLTINGESFQESTFGRPSRDKVF